MRYQQKSIHKHMEARLEQRKNSKMQAQLHSHYHMHKQNVNISELLSKRKKQNNNQYLATDIHPIVLTNKLKHHHSLHHRSKAIKKQITHYKHANIQVTKSNGISITETK